MIPTQLRLLQMNDVRLVGRLTRDPEVRYTPKGQAVARLDLAVNRRFKDGTANGGTTPPLSPSPSGAKRRNAAANA